MATYQVWRKILKWGHLKVLAPTPKQGSRGGRYATTAMPPPNKLPPEFAVTFNFDKRTQLDFVNNITIIVLQDSKKIEESCITSETLR